MQIIVETDGVLINLRAAYWEAYQTAIHEIGYACTDEGTFWRVIRRGDPLSLVVQGGKPRHVELFEAKFKEALATPEVGDKLELHEDAQVYVERLRKLGTCHLVTLSAQATAHARLLRGVFSSDAPTVHTLEHRRAKNQLPSIVGSNRPVVVLSAHERLIRTAEELGFVSVGIASGSCIGKRMPGFGAVANYRNVSAFCDARAEGDAPLVRAGIQGDRR